MEDRLKYWIGRVAFCGAFVLLAGCASGGVRTVAAADLPGNAIISYPNSLDKAFTTVLLSNPDAIQAGIDGRVLTVSVFNRQALYANELTLDINGNLGIRGIVASRSSRAEKKDIQVYRDDALDLLSRVRIVSYRYRNEGESVSPHIGFIAEDAPAQFTGPEHTSFNLNNSLSINMAATQELGAKVATLEREVTLLRAEIKSLRQRR